MRTFAESVMSCAMRSAALLSLGSSACASHREQLREYWWRCIMASLPRPWTTSRANARASKELDHTMAAQAEAELRECWRGADDATKQSHRVQEGANIKMQNAFKQAQRFNVDAGLEAWVEDQNVQKGINPAPSLLLRQASMLKASQGVKAAGTRRGERRWMQRWRARRGLQLRKFPAQERLPVELMQRKVRHREGGYFHRLVVVFAAPRMSHITKKGGRFPVQFSGPPMGTEQKL